MTTEIEKFGLIINRRIHKINNAKSGIVAELGTIGSNKSLKVASLGNSIPKGDYLMNEDITGLSSGDRVLVLWCGNEPVVAAVLKES